MLICPDFSFSRVLFAFFSMALVQSCSSTGDEISGSSHYAPGYPPTGWIHDFSYEEPLDPYLQRQAEKAKLLGKRPLVYVFAGWQKHNSWDRALSVYDTGMLSTLFDDKYVILINSTYLKDLALNTEVNNGNPYPRAGNFIPLDETGKRINPIFYIPRDTAYTREERYDILRESFELIDDRW